MSTLHNALILALTAALAFALSCSTSTTTGPAPPGPGDEDCPGERVETDEDGYCILIEEGFQTSDCPEAYPNGRDLEGAIACDDDEEIPDDLRDDLERDGVVGDARECDGEDCAERFGVERCRPGEDCFQTCSSGDCQSQCEGDSSCFATCSGGGCTRTCLDEAACTFTCSGGGCTFRCAESATCATDCTGGGCETTTADIPDAVATCADLCDASGAMIDAELECLHTVLTDLEHDVAAEPACADEPASFPDTCAACTGALAIPDADCAQAYESCLGRVDLDSLDVGGGESRTCQGEETCIDSCSDSRCEVTCGDTSTCIQSCSGGSCLFTCADEATCTFNCSGGDCLFRKSGDGVMLTSCTGGGCLFDYQ